MQAVLWGAWRFRRADHAGGLSNECQDQYKVQEGLSEQSDPSLQTSLQSSMAGSMEDMLKELSDEEYDYTSNPELIEIMVHAEALMAQIHDAEVQMKKIKARNKKRSV